MGDISRNLSLSETACQCDCGLNAMHPFAVAGVQRMADAMRVPRGGVIITSGCRCVAHNANEGGVSGSVHCPDDIGLCRAVDAIFTGRSIAEMYGAAMSWPEFASGGIGLYIPDEDGRGGPVRIHVDARGRRARWGKIGTGRVRLPVVLSVASERGL